MLTSTGRAGPGWWQGRDLVRAPVLHLLIAVLAAFECLIPVALHIAGQLIDLPIPLRACRDQATYT
jgi:hypothetical protein